MFKKSRKKWCIEQQKQQATILREKLECRNSKKRENCEIDLQTKNCMMRPHNGHEFCYENHVKTINETYYAYYLTLLKNVKQYAKKIAETDISSINNEKIKVLENYVIRIAEYLKKYKQIKTKYSIFCKLFKETYSKKPEYRFKEITNTKQTCNANRKIRTKGRE